jgi:ATP-dependent DNA helicase RecG
MNQDDLLAVVSDGESGQIEFKRSTGSLHAGFQSVCALLNGRKLGWVLFGVGDDGRLLGQEVSTRTLEEIAAEIRKIDPLPALDIESVEVDGGRAVIAIAVPGGTGLYSYDGRAYQRVGPTTSVMPREAYARKLLEEVHSTSRWELEPAVDRVTIADLDEVEVLRTVDSAIHLGRLIRFAIGPPRPSYAVWS